MKHGLVSLQNPTRKSESMKLDQWMTEFYGMPWYRLDSMDDPMLCKQEGLYELRLSSDDFLGIIEAQKHGFSLVESFIEFATKVEPSQEEYEGIRLMNKSDHSFISALNEQSMCQNEGYRTRFNNPIFFDENACKNYYGAAITNNINDPNVLTAVVEFGNEVVGFFMLKIVDQQTCKGLMTGVIPKARGMKFHIKMQQFLINHIGHPFTLINTTQLSNLAVIKNHIRSNRSLSKIEHIFYKKVQ